MYEFIDADGVRVTIRSARTLGQLLANGTIKAATRFRLAGEPGFRPADEHPSLIQIASQVGIPFNEPPLQPQASPQAPEIPLPQQSALPVPIPNADVRPARHRGSVPSTPPSAVALPAATIPSPLAASPWTRARSGSSASPFGPGLTICGSLLTAVILGLLAGAAAGLITTSAVVGWLVTVAAASWCSRLAGRRLARRTPCFSRAQIGAGSAAFLAGCLLAGWSGVVVGLPACAVLWTTLGERQV